MVARWHLDLAAVALACGLLIVVIGMAAAVVVRGRVIALAGLLGVLLGDTSLLGQGSPRAWPWFLAALIVVVPADDGKRVHPLGWAVLPMTIASLIGVWSAVPDTEPALAVACVLIPLTVASMLRGLAPQHGPVWMAETTVIGPASTMALVVAIAGSVWVGSAGWGSALATGFVIGMVAVVPTVVGFRRVDGSGDKGVLNRAARTALITAHVIATLVLPRVVMRRSVPVAVAIAVGVIVVMAGMTVAADRVACREL